MHWRAAHRGALTCLTLVKLQVRPRMYTAGGDPGLVIGALFTNACKGRRK